MNFVNTNIRDFIKHIVAFDSVDDILKSCGTQSEKGCVFEKLFDVVIKFGFCDAFPNSEFEHLVGNSNDAKLKVLQDLDRYLDKAVFGGNSGGCSDITLRSKSTGEYVFVSSKYPKQIEKVSYYDV